MTSAELRKQADDLVKQAGDIKSQADTEERTLTEEEDKDFDVIHS